MKIFKRLSAMILKDFSDVQLLSKEEMPEMSE